MPNNKTTTHLEDASGPSQAYKRTPQGPATPSSDLDLSQGQDHERYITILVLLLLIILCLGALASFSIAPYFLTQKSLLVKSKSTIYENGMCAITAPAIDDKHFSSYHQKNMALSLSWTQVGKSNQKLAHAQICATTFTVVYKTSNVKMPLS